MPNLQLNTETLMLEEHGIPMFHLLDHPAIYRNLTHIQVPTRVQEYMGIEEDTLSIMFYSDSVICEKCYTDSQVAYIIPSIPEWSITFCRKDGVLWGKLEEPIVIH